MKILFYYHEANNDLFALIDSETCYSHIGQHSNVSKSYINESKKVTAHRQDVKELKKELISIGYIF